MNKKIIKLTLCFILTLTTIVGCGKTDTPNEESLIPESTTESTETTIEEKEEEFKLNINVIKEDIINPDYSLNIKDGKTKYQLTTNKNIRLLSFYNVSIGENKLSYIKEENIEKYENITSEDTFVMNYDAINGVADIGIQIIIEEGIVFNYILECNNDNCDITLKPYSFDINKIDNSTLLEFKSFRTYAMDIDNDDEKEKVLFTPEFNREYGYYELKMTIDEKEYKNELLYSLKEPKSFSICNFNNMPIIILNFTQENDYNFTCFYIYKNNNLIPITTLEDKESIQGIPGETLFIKDGIISTTEIIDCLATTNINTQYKISEDNSKIERIIPDEKFYSYNVYEDKELIALKEIKVYKEMTETAEEIIIEAGTKFTSNKTDGGNWSNVILETGEEYWINFDSTNIENHELIEGLIFAG